MNWLMTKKSTTKCVQELPHFVQTVSSSTNFQEGGCNVELKQKLALPSGCLGSSLVLPFTGCDFNQDTPSVSLSFLICKMGIYNYFKRIASVLNENT